MVQKEAAQRLCAAPGTRDAGAISYAVAYYAEPKLLLPYSPAVFTRPKRSPARSSATNVRKTPAVEVPGGDEKAFFSLIRAAFSQRRKTAANAISNGLRLPKATVLSASEAAHLDPRSPSEQLTLQDYAPCKLLFRLEIIYFFQKNHKQNAPEHKPCSGRFVLELVIGLEPTTC